MNNKNCTLITLSVLFKAAVNVLYQMSFEHNLILKKSFPEN